MVLIFYAFSREMRRLKRHLLDRAPIGMSGLRGFRGRLGDREIVAVATGIGARMADAAARLACEALPAPSLVIATGVAGALIDDLKPGDLVLADRILGGLHPDGTVEMALEVPGEHLRLFQHSLKGRELRFSTGAILTTPRVLANESEKRAAARLTGAIAVDMESAAIAAVIGGNRRAPLACIRAVLDSVDDTVVGAELAGEHGELRPLAAAAFLLRHPAAALALPRMARAMTRASATIADAVVALVEGAAASPAAPSTSAGG